MHRRHTTFLLLLPVALLIAGAASSAAEEGAQCIPRGSHWQGGLEFRGDRWPLRFHVDESLDARLDIPELLMIGLPVTISCEGEETVLELPFGFGNVALAQTVANSIVGSQILAGDTLTVTFWRDTPPPYEVDSITFRSGDVSLAGSLYLPNSAGPHTTVVMVHGSGPQGRDMIEYRSWGDFLARQGVAVLLYDKRGVGESGGDFEADSAFTALTSDVLAAVRYLEKRPEIDAQSIGLSGASQAGWIAYEAAHDPAVAFLALLVPPSVGVPEQEIQRVRATMEAEGYLPQAVDVAVGHTRLLMAVAATGLGWDGLATSTARIAEEPWAQIVHRPSAQEDLSWWRDHAAVDPWHAIEVLRVPLFAAFSAGDAVVPAAPNAGPLRDLAAREGGREWTVLTVSRGNHRLEVPAGRDEHGNWRLPRIHSDVLIGLAGWLDERRRERVERPEAKPVVPEDPPVAGDVLRY